MFSMARYLFVATGHVKAQAKLDAIAVPVRVVAVLLAAPFGLVWVAWAVLLGALFRCWITYRYLAVLSGLGLAAMLRAVRKSLLLCALTTAPAVLVLLALPPQTGRLLLPLALAGSGALLCWCAGVVLLKHEIGAEFALVGRKVRALVGADQS